MGKHTSFITIGKAGKTSLVNYDWHDHEFQAVPIAEKYQVYISSYTSARFTENQSQACRMPDLFVALDSCWENIAGGVWTNTHLDVSSFGYLVPMMVIDWADGARLPTGQLSKIVPMIIRLILEGKTIEIGCVGGHGRSGTLLALILGKMERLSAHEAIEETRRRFCPDAIETKAQIRAVYNMLGGSNTDCLADQAKIFTVPYGDYAWYGNAVSGLPITSAPPKTAEDMCDMWGLHPKDCPFVGGKECPESCAYWEKEFKLEGK